MYSDCSSDDYYSPDSFECAYDYESRHRRYEDSGDSDPYSLRRYYEDSDAECPCKRMKTTASTQTSAPFSQPSQSQAKGERSSPPTAQSSSQAVEPHQPDGAAAGAAAAEKAPAREPCYPAASSARSVTGGVGVLRFYGPRSPAAERHCVHCLASGKHSKAEWRCDRCNVPLCLQPHRNCFRDWHKVRR